MVTKDKERMSEGGVIINVSSIYGECSNEYMGVYAASNAGFSIGPWGARVKTGHYLLLLLLRMA
jgi:hypothetical protein